MQLAFQGLTLQGLYQIIIFKIESNKIAVLLRIKDH
jgi:hypothetical protein